MAHTGAVAGQTITSINGERCAADAPAVSARDRGLTLADGVFETMRARNGRVFQVDAHLARLWHGLEVLRISMTRDPAQLVKDVVKGFGDGEASVRLTVTRGPGPAGLHPPADVAATVIVTVSPMPQFDERIYAEGLTARVVDGRRNQRAATAGLKTLSYTDAVAGLLEAQAHGADEALFLDTDDHCSEASASNLFFWTGSTLVTPPLTCGALPGVTRATVLDLAAGLGLDVAERVCTVEDLLTSNEAFLTSSLRGLAPLVRVDGRAVGNGAPGPVTRRLALRHAERFAQETGG